jgi:hypothetical protein
VRTFDLADGRLGGPGAELLREAARGAHVVALGENHNTRAIPELTVALFRMLHDEHGFDYLALEEGPAIAWMLSERVRAGRPDGALQLGREFPNAFHMYTEEELRMIDRVAAISAAPAEPIWGLNQEFGLAHVLDRLVRIAPTDEARRAAEAFLRRSREYEGERFAKKVAFISHVATPADFRALREAFRPAPGSEADRLIAQAALSHEIYAPYATKPQPPASAFYASGRRREENMKALFAERYREARARGAAQPKVLVKSGHVHLTRGLGAFNETFTLGNFLSEVATFEGGASLHLHVVLNWDDLPKGFLAPFAAHARSGTNTLFDLRPLRAWAAFTRGLDPELRRVLLGADVLIILADTSRGSVRALRTPNFNWYSGS